MLRRQKREEQPLIERPVLSDELPEDPEQPQKKKSWRKRLFRGGKKNKKDDELSGDRSNEYEVPNLSKSSSSTSGPVPKPPPERQEPQQQQQQQQSKQQQQKNQPEQKRPEKRDPKNDRRDDSTSSGKSSQDPPEEQPQEQPAPAIRSVSLDKHMNDDENRQRQLSITDLASPQPTVMSTFSKKKTPRAKGGTGDISKKSAPPSTSTMILKRPFGRDGLASSQQTWIVQISAAEWEPEQSAWKYRIGLQKRTPEGVQEALAAFRSLPDFSWLERSLQAEFHGGLLLPNLSIALGVPELAQCQHEVDARLLTNWLSDVLNGVRGQGEMIFGSNNRGSVVVDETSKQELDLMSSESMEAFLYRIELNDADIVDLSLPLVASPRSPLGGEFIGDDDEEGESKAWGWMYPELCVSGGCVKPTPGGNRQQRPFLAKPKPKLPLRKMNCASAALGDARSFNVQDSFVENVATFDTAHHVPIAIHSDILKAEKDLVWSWRTQALRVMEKMSVLQQEEKQVGLSWKRFAISVSNLFAYEKDVESAKLGDTRNMQMPYKKLQKSAVDDCLRILARQRVERSTPSLEGLNVMLSAYVADLSAVQPSVQAYLEGLQQLALHQEHCEALKPNDNQNKKGSAASLAGQIQAGILDLKKQLGTVGQDADSNQQLESYQRQRQQTHMLERRVLMNEALLKDFLTTLCQTAPIRTARMAYAYFSMESKQCSLLHGAAINMKNKINVTTKESLSKMVARHHKEQSADRAVELTIVQRLVNINNAKKFLKDDPNISEEVEKGVEINNDGVTEEGEKSKLREKAMNMCRERIGRWDAKLAMALMEAVGVSDANVRVEETTRDLRMVRKYAIGLRENVQRCSEALENVKQAVLKGEYGDIRDLRHDFVAELQELFSTIYVPVDDVKVPPAPEKLERVGIKLNDASGWRKSNEGTCGGAVKRYMENRDSSAEWLLDSLGELQKEYTNRIEAVESFVYMECVGIQLEKHFSNERATALAAFEKKTDITSAINIATRKRMPALVKELQAKLADVGADVSHTTVKEAKEAHLESKKLKEDLHTLGMKRLARSQETSTERVIALMTVWSKEDEGTANTELMLLQEVLHCLEHSLGKEEVAAYLEVAPGSLNIA